MSDFKIVGIGASAGGLVALKTLLGYLPEEPGVAIVVVVHLSPEHESHLSELLQPHCRMQVQQVMETTALAPNQVYVIPPNANLEAVDTHLRLTSLDERPVRSPIDHFFRSLAETRDGGAIGIVLTGSGSDGTLGMRHIKERGGVTIAQAPAEAAYDSMPRSAIAADVVDLVLPARGYRATHRRARPPRAAHPGGTGCRSRHRRQAHPAPRSSRRCAPVPDTTSANTSHRQSCAASAGACR